MRKGSLTSALMTPVRKSQPSVDRQSTSVRARQILGFRGLQGKLDEGPHLGRRVLPRRVQRIQGKDLARPIRKEIDEPAGGKVRLDADAEDLRHARPGETFVDH